jgi:hypothetical protein
LRIQRILKNQKLKGKFRRFTSLKEWLVGIMACVT